MSHLKSVFLHTFFFTIPTVCAVRLETSRLILRTWEEADIRAFQQIMQNPAVVEYLGIHHFDKPETTVSLANSANKSITEKGYGYFVCEEKISGTCIGLAGLNFVEKPAAPPFPLHTVSWILRQESWGKGYATEAARALLSHGFDTHNIAAIFACTMGANLRSRQVMSRVGMRYEKEFDFPGVPTDDQRCKYVLYGITQEQFNALK